LRFNRAGSNTLGEPCASAVQIATDNWRQHPFLIREHFGYEGYSFGMETKVFGEPELSDGTVAALGKNQGVRKMQTAERKAVVGSPDLGSLQATLSGLS